MKASQGKLLVSLFGPTAVGKTEVAISLAREFNSEIISADSRQFYREMNIGTAKPSQAQLNLIPHHFINSLSVTREFNASLFEKQALEKIEELFLKKDLGILAGGSGLYLHALWFGFDDETAASDERLRKFLNEEYRKFGLDHLRNRLRELDADALSGIDENNPVRIIRAIEICTVTGNKLSAARHGKVKERPFRQLRIGLDLPRAELHRRIEERVDKMMNSGLVEEARSLVSFRNENALKTVGYQELFRYFDGEYSLSEAVNRIKKNTRSYAKRQLTWFRRYRDVKWFSPLNLEGILETVKANI